MDLLEAAGLTFALVGLAAGAAYLLYRLMTWRS